MLIMRLRIALHIFAHSRWPLRIVAASLGATAGMIALTLFKWHDVRAVFFWGVIFVCEVVFALLAWFRPNVIK